MKVKNIFTCTDLIFLIPMSECCINFIASFDMLNIFDRDRCIW